MKAMWKRLNSGEWGVKVTLETPFENVAVGDTVTVTKADESTSEQTIKRIIWEGEDTRDGGQGALCAIERRPRSEAENE